MGDDLGTTQSHGPNEWLVDEMYEQYRADPSSVSKSWQEFFADYRRDDQPAAQPEAPAAAAAAAAPAAPAQAPADKPAPKPAATAPPKPQPKKEAADVQPLRGAAARIVQNMEA